MYYNLLCCKVSNLSFLRMSDLLDFETDKKSSIIHKVWSSVSVRKLFNEEHFDEIESRIDQICQDAEKGLFKPCTVDRAPLRNK